MVLTYLIVSQSTQAYSTDSVPPAHIVPNVEISIDAPRTIRRIGDLPIIVRVINHETLGRCILQALSLADADGTTLRALSINTELPAAHTGPSTGLAANRTTLGNIWSFQLPEYEVCRLIENSDSATLKVSASLQWNDSPSEIETCFSLYLMPPLPNGHRPRPVYRHNPVSDRLVPDPRQDRPLPDVPYWFAGDQHVHSRFSIDTYFPEWYPWEDEASPCTVEQLGTAARMHGLHWLIITDHSNVHMLIPEYYDQTEFDDGYTESLVFHSMYPDFTILYAQEMGTSVTTEDAIPAHLLAYPYMGDSTGYVDNPSSGGVVNYMNCEPAQDIIDRIVGTLHQGMCFIAHPFKGDSLSPAEWAFRSWSNWNVGLYAGLEIYSSASGVLTEEDELAIEHWYVFLDDIVPPVGEVPPDPDIWFPNWFPAGIGNSDAHNAENVGKVFTYCWFDLDDPDTTPTTAMILQALGAGHCVASNGPLLFGTLADAQVGEVATICGGQENLVVDIHVIDYPNDPDDAVGAYTLKVVLDGVTVLTDPLSGITSHDAVYPIALSLDPDVNRYLVLRLDKDDGQYHAITNPIWVVRDVLPPNDVSLSAPAEVTTGDVVALSATAGDNCGIERVEFWVAGQLLCTDATPPYGCAGADSCCWDTTGYSGSITVETIAYDSAGNYSSDQAIITVQAQASQGLTFACNPPAVPVDGESFATLTATVTEESGIPLPGVPVTFDLIAGTYGQWVDASGQAVTQPDNGPTDSQGQRRTYFRPTHPNTTCSFMASIPGDSATCSFEAIPPPSLIITITARLLVRTDTYADYKIEAGFKYPSGEPVENGTAEFTTTVGYWLNGTNPGGQTTQRDISVNGVADANLRIFATGPGYITACYVEGDVCSAPQEFMFSLETPPVIESEFQITGPHGGVLRYLDVGYNCLATLEYDQALTIWDMNTWTVIRNWNKSDSPVEYDDWPVANCLSLSYSDDRVVVPHQRTIAVFDIAAGTVSYSDPPSPLDPDEDCDWHPSSVLWATVDEADEADGIDLYTGTAHCRHVDTLDGSPKAVRWSPDGSRLAYTYRDYSASPSISTLRIRNAPTCAGGGSIIATLQMATGAITGGVTWSPSSQCVAALDGDGTLRIYDRNGGASGCALTAVPLPGSWHGALCWSPDGQYIAVYGGVGSGILIIDATTGLEVAVCQFPTEGEDTKDALGWRGDSQILVATGLNSTQVRIYAPFDTTEPELTIAAPQSGSYTYDSEIQVSGSAQDDLQYGIIPNSLKWQLDETGWSPVTFPSSGGSFALVIPLTEGLHLIGVQVSDLAGHVAHRSVQIERRLMPWIVHTDVTDASPHQGEPTTIWATVSDGRGHISDATVTGFVVAPDGTPIERPMPFVEANARYEALLVCTQQGIYSGYARASRTGMADGTGTFPDITASNAPPETSITSTYPAEGQGITQHSLELAWIGSDTGTPVGSLQYAWMLDAGPWSAWADERSAGLSDLGEGVHTFAVKAFDGALEDPTPALRTFSVDSLAPAVAITTDGGNGPGVDFITSAQEAILEGTAVDPSPSSGLAAVTINIGAPNEGSLENWRFDVQLVPGANHLEVIANDFTGNTGTATITITRTALGDLNCDGMLSLVDISHFVQALVDPAGYDTDHDGSPYPPCNRLLADINDDTDANGLDVQLFLDALLESCVPPTIVSQPTSPSTVCQEDSVMFAVSAGGTNPTYQWHRDGTPLNDNGRITGATTEHLSIDPVLSSDAGVYIVVVSGDCGSPTPSEPAILAVSIAPEIAPIPPQTTSPGIPWTGPTPVLLAGTTPIDWLLVEGPEGMLIDDATGLVTWPNPTTDGSPFTITISAANACAAVETSFLLIVCPFEQLMKLVASDGEDDDHFGAALDISGDFAVIGGFQHDEPADNAGSAYVFRLLDGAWQEEQRLFAADGDGQDQFGRAVAIQGDTIVVGAFNDDGASGAVYVYRNSVSQWLQEGPKLTGRGGRFGWSLGIDGDVLVVGAYMGNYARILRRIETSWEFEAELAGTDALSGDAFGTAVAISGNVAVVGAPNHDHGLDNSGAAYVFRYNGTSWAPERELRADVPAVDDNYGSSVACTNEIVVVGAGNHDSAAQNAGAVFVYRHNGGDWQLESKLTASDYATGDRFGQGAVSIAGDLILVGSDQDDDLGVDSGSAYLFQRIGSVWIQVQKLHGSDTTTQDRFGLEACIDGSTVFVGADHKEAHTGAAYVFERICGPR